MSDDIAGDAKALIEAAKSLPELTAEVAALNARMKQVESFLGHIHAAAEAVEKPFQEFPKQVGEFIAHSAAEEQKLLAAMQKGAA